MPWFLVLLIASEALAAPSCFDRWKRSALGKDAGQTKAIADFIAQKTSDKVPASVQKQIDYWGEEFVGAVALDLEQRVLSVCADKALAALLQTLQKTYIAKMGWRHPASDPSKLFRGLFAAGDDAKAIKAALKKPSEDPAFAKKKPLEILSAIYGSAAEVDGVLVIGAKPDKIDVLKAVARRACARKRPCPLWDPVFLGRVTVLPVKGVAAYVPELANLRIGEDLIAEFTPLRQVVLIHELAHSAQWRAKQRTGVDWKEGFAAFSQWKELSGGIETPIRSIAAEWGDELARESKESEFSLLPDPVMPQMGSADGFVFAKTERETKRVNDIGEDIADHIAAFVVAPERFCFQSKRIAPLKYAWIAKEVFGVEKKLTCTPLE